MMLSELTAPGPDALPIAAFRDHLRMGSGFGADDAAETAALAGYLRAAIATIEARTGKVLLSRRFRLKLSQWRDDDVQMLPLAPVSRVERIELSDAAGESRDYPTANWRLVEDTQRPWIAPTTGLLPMIDDGGSVTITFEAGFGAAWSDVPPELSQAVMLLAARYYEDRSFEGTASAIPFGVSALIERWRSVRLLGGRRKVRA